MKFDFVIKEISRAHATDFVQSLHYSKVMPKLTKHFLGCYLENELVGVLTLGWGTQPKATIAKLFNGLESKDYYEIGKMALLDEMPRNTETQFLSAIIKWIKQNIPELKYLYTLADGIQGKCGYVYQAANFYYGGSYTTMVYRSKQGEKIHPRTASELCKENAKMLGKDKVFWLTADFLKFKEIDKIQGLMFRYIYPLNKKAKKYLKESTVDWNKNYPKEKDLIYKKLIEKGKYVEIEQPTFNKDNYHYNTQKILKKERQLELWQ